MVGSGKKYFAFLDGEQKGPFDLRQLIDTGVRPSTYVWCKGMDDWHRADEVEEIRDLFTDHLSNRQETPKPAAPETNPWKKEPASSDASRERPARRGRFGVELPSIDEIKPDVNAAPQLSMALAVLAMILCFLPTGIAAVIFTYKSLKCWDKSKKASDGNERESLKAQCHEYERQAKMWLGITVAFGFIFWTVVLSSF